MVALELEVMAKKMDRFGWERDRGSVAHDRMVTDWMDVLHDFPLAEVQAGCRDWVRSHPRKMPNEGDILSRIEAARSQVLQARKAQMPPKEEAVRPRLSRARAAEIMAEVGFVPKRIGG